MLRPSKIRIIKETKRIFIRYGASVAPKTPTPTPKNVNTSVNPATNAQAFRKTRKRPAPLLLPKYIKYTGTSGKRHGEKNDNRPATNAPPIKMSAFTDHCPRNFFSKSKCVHKRN